MSVIQPLNPTTTTTTNPHNLNPSSSSTSESDSDPDKEVLLPLPLKSIANVELNPPEKCSVNGANNGKEANNIEAAKGDEENETKACKRYLGLILAILSSLMFSINALIFKMLNYNPPLTPGIFMFLGTAILNLPLYLYQRFKKTTKTNVSSRQDFGDDFGGWKIFGILLARAFTGCSGMLFFFYSLQYMSIGDALVIACSSPIFVFLLAFVFLKENCGIVPILTIILALIGVVIITRPPLLTGEESFKQDDLIGVALAFASMLSIASTLVLMRYLQTVHHSLINLVFGVWGTLQTLGLALTFGQLEFPKSLYETVVMSSTGFVFFVGQSFLALALQLEEAGPVSLLRTSEVVFAFIWQFLFLNVYPDLFSLSGAVLIMIGIVTTLLRKWIAALPATHVVRKRLGILLK